MFFLMRQPHMATTTRVKNPTAMGFFTLFTFIEHQIHLKETTETIYDLIQAKLQRVLPN